MPVTRGIGPMVDEAMAETDMVSLEKARDGLADGSMTLVDIRDIRELQREGTIDGSSHAPRDMIEFWVDPESPYYKPAFGEERTYVIYCFAGGARSALTTKRLQDMGFGPVAHLEGGFRAWRDAGFPVKTLEKKD